MALQTSKRDLPGSLLYIYRHIRTNQVIYTLKKEIKVRSSQRITVLEAADTDRDVGDQGSETAHLRRQENCTQHHPPRSLDSTMYRRVS
jgi:hypothetical protein